ncbi:PAS domain-containing sensor histidine kinase [Parvularcula flava]|uniref:histidine kinase n=1 Tax=Aquisalinus luteolus TaxID=1566827 RepID=A0A8J3A9L3_9PROT|nr:PAS domain-containing sensor histidine kinase [Aquisalinus luteolus]NHK29570.1 PAS domain-containing sensor histidine kinase [Aquisalinus luteolus]GGI01545.1 hypothetical protein GCM10011355_32450 [Aquisalinus luteolus]
MVNPMINALRTFLTGSSHADSLWTGDSDDMIALHHADGRFSRISESARLVTGHDPEALAGKPLSAIIAPGDRGAAFNALASACYRGGKARAEFRILKADGSIGWAEMAVSADGKGRVRSIIRDIGERHANVQAHAAAREEAEEQATAHTTYLADLSHEIRTPLNAVIGFAEMMKHETFGPLGHQKYEEYAGLIHKSGQHLLSLVSDLLDLSKLEAERYQLEPQPTDIAGLVNDCVEMTRLGAEEAGLTMTADLDALPDDVLVDQKVLRQIVLNLISNAVKFTREGGIEVRLRHDGESMWISVIDTGIGMNADQLANIGKRFTKAQRDGVRGAKGTGLGLALCDALARLHEGELRLASREGEGTRAVLCLPLVAAGEQSADDEDADASSVLDRLGLAIASETATRERGVA